MVVDASSGELVILCAALLALPDEDIDEAGVPELDRVIFDRDPLAEIEPLLGQWVDRVVLFDELDEGLVRELLLLLFVVLLVFSLLLFLGAEHPWDHQWVFGGAGALLSILDRSHFLLLCLGVLCLLLSAQIVTTYLTALAALAILV